MTIELGFAHLDLPSDGPGRDPIRVGIVDVPGHERFVRTMVAGATGIDIGMLVVAADDGVMPQTREHVEILDFLGIQTGLIAISKVDLVHADRVDAVRSQVTELLDGTSLRGWPIVPTAATRGDGLDAIRATLRDLIGNLPSRESSSIFRMAIDRVFSIHGRGTVVTGSVLSGSAEVGATLELHPAGKTCKVREMQSHGSSAVDVAAGQRAALNLTGIDRDQIDRGMELATPGYLTPTRYIDAQVRILPRVEKPFPSHRRVRVAVGTTEVIAMLVVVDGTHIEPGQERPVQLRLNRPVVASHGQRFIVRDETARSTIGGGRVVRPVSRRFRPRQKDEAAALARAGDDDAYVRYAEALRSAGFESWSPNRAACAIGVKPEDIEPFSERFAASDDSIEIRGRRVHSATVDAIERRTLAYLERHHADRATEPGVLRDRLIGWIDKRSIPGWGKEITARLLSAERIRLAGPYMAHGEFRPALSPEDAALLERLVAEIGVAEFDVPAWPKLETVVSLSKQRARMLDDLAKCEPRLVSIGPQHYLTAEALVRLRNTVRELAASGPFKLAQVRDVLGLSRRVVQPLLEYLDRVGYSKRVGDERILMEKQA